MKFELYRAARADWRFRIIAANGEIIAQSEGYRRKIDCKNAIGLIQRNAADAAVVEVQK